MPHLDHRLHHLNQLMPRRLHPHLDHRLHHLDHRMRHRLHPHPAQAAKPSIPPRQLGPGRTGCGSPRGLISRAASLGSASVSVDIDTEAGIE